MAAELLDEVTNTNDAVNIEVAAGRDLSDYAVILQVYAAAGTFDVEVFGPLQEWTLLAEDVDPSVYPVVVINAGANEAYTAVRGRFTGTSNTNRFRAQLKRLYSGPV